MKQAIVMSIPVRTFKATAPPNTSIAITIELASKAKNKNTLWPNFPNLRYRNSVKVWEEGARFFNSRAITAKRMICILAPAAYQNGPLMPYLYATVDDSKRVAAQIQADITDYAKRPLLILLPAVENHSNVFLVPSHLVSTKMSNNTITVIIRPPPMKIK